MGKCTECPECPKHRECAESLGDDSFYRDRFERALKLANTFNDMHKSTKVAYDELRSIYDTLKDDHVELIALYEERVRR